MEPGSNVLVVRKAGLASGMRPRVPVVANARRDVGDVELGAGETLLGVVRDHAGRPVTGAEIRVAPIGMLGYRGLTFADRPIRTDAAGRLEATGLPRGRVFVAVRRDVAWPWTVIGPVRSDDDLEIELPRPHSLTLTVVGADGADIEQPELELLAGPPLGELARAGIQQRLPVEDRLGRDRDGKLVLRDLPAGCYTLRVAAGVSHARPRTLLVRLPREQPLRVELATAVTVTARVVDPAGEPVAGAKVYVVADDDLDAALPNNYGVPRWRKPPTLAGTTDGRGELPVTDVSVTKSAGGGVELIAIHPARSPALVRLTEMPAAGAVIDFVLQPGGEIRGRVFESGRPADPRRFRVVAEPRSWGVAPARELCTNLQTDGTFVFEHVQPAEYVVFAEPIEDRPLSFSTFIEGFSEVLYSTFRITSDTVEERVNVKSGESVAVEFDLVPHQPEPGEVGATLRGRVLVDGRPLGGDVVLQMRDDRYRYSDLVRVAADGTFVVDSIAPGQQMLRLQCGGVERWRGEVTLQIGSATVLDLSWRSATIRGRVAFTGATWPVEDYTVRAEVLATEASRATAGVAATGSYQQVARTDASGSFELTGLPVGTVQLVARGGDGKSAPLRLELGPDGRREVLVPLLETPVLSGRVELGERSRRGSMIFLQADGVFYGTSLQEGGRFRFSNLDRVVYEISLRLDGEVVPLTQARFDLRDGTSHRDLVLEIEDRGR